MLTVLKDYMHTKKKKYSVENQWSWSVTEKRYVDISQKPVYRYGGLLFVDYNNLLS